MLKDLGKVKGLFFGKRIKKLKQFKEDVADIPRCMACGTPMCRGDEFGVIGEIREVKNFVYGSSSKVGWYYIFVKMCSACLGKMSQAISAISEAELPTAIQEAQKAKEDEASIKKILKKKKGSENEVKKVTGSASFIEVDMRKAEITVLMAILEKGK